MPHLIIKAALAALGVALLSGCVSYPYETRFGACDAEAGACYRDCEIYAGEVGYGACHADCEYRADRCFAAAYAPYGAAYVGYASPWPWYGRYGVWRPETGFAFSFGYYDYNHYGYLRRPPRRGDYYDHDRRRQDDDRWRERRGRDSDDGRNRNRSGDRNGYRYDGARLRSDRGDGPPPRSGGQPGYTPRARPPSGGSRPLSRPPGGPPRDKPRQQSPAAQPQAAPKPAATPPRSRGSGAEPQRRTLEDGPKPQRK